MPWINVQEHPDAALPKEEKAERAKLAKISPKKKQKKMRFYVDANVSPQVVQVLIEMGYDALTAREARIETHEDDDQIAIARKQDRILITHDRDFLNDRRFPLHECPTLVVCSFGTGTKDEILTTFNFLRILEWGGQVPGGQVPTMGVKIDANPSQWTEITRYQEGFSDRYIYRIHQGEWQVWVEPA